MKLKIIPFGEYITPTRGHYNDSGIDAYSTASHIVEPNGLIRIPLNFGIDIPNGYEIQVRPRSSMNAKSVLTQFGTVDAGYKGNIQVMLLNLSGKPVIIKEGDKIAQLVLAPVVYCELCDDLGEERETNGFGSTGI